LASRHYSRYIETSAVRINCCSGTRILTQHRSIVSYIRENAAENLTTQLTIKTEQIAPVEHLYNLPPARTSLSYGFQASGFAHRQLVFVVRVSFAETEANAHGGEIDGKGEEAKVKVA